MLATGTEGPNDPLTPPVPGLTGARNQMQYGSELLDNEMDSGHDAKTLASSKAVIHDAHALRTRVPLTKNSTKFPSTAGIRDPLVSGPLAERRL